MGDRRLGWSEMFDPATADAGNTVPFLLAAQALANHAKLIVEVGCGRGGAVAAGVEHAFQDLRGAGRTVVGMDIDPTGAENPVIDEFRVIPANGIWPVADGVADLVVSDWVLEHVVDAEQFVAELSRVLRPGGAFLARTVSRNSPLSVAARLIPNNHHSRVLERVQPGREARDVFPTMYRMNSRRDLARLLDADYDWSVENLGGLHHYLQPWPRLARAVRAVEPRLPRSWRTTIVISCRKRASARDR